MTAASTTAATTVVSTVITAAASSSRDLSVSRVESGAFGSEKSFHLLQIGTEDLEFVEEQFDVVLNHLIFFRFSRGNFSHLLFHIRADGRVTQLSGGMGWNGMEWIGLDWIGWMDGWNGWNGWNGFGLDGMDGRMDGWMDGWNG